MTPEQKEGFGEPYEWHCPKCNHHNLVYGECANCKTYSIGRYTEGNFKLVTKGS